MTGAFYLVQNDIHFPLFCHSENMNSVLREFRTDTNFGAPNRTSLFCFGFSVVVFHLVLCCSNGFSGNIQNLL